MRLPLVNTCMCYKHSSTQNHCLAGGKKEHLTAEELIHFNSEWSPQQRQEESQYQTCEIMSGADVDSHMLKA